MVQTAGKGGSVGAGALHTGPLQLPKSTCPAQELAVALPGRWEASSVQQEPGAGDEPLRDWWRLYALTPAAGWGWC